MSELDLTLKVNEIIKNTLMKLTSTGRAKIKKKREIQGIDIKEPTDPEAFTKEELIRPVIKSLGLEIMPERKFRIFGRERKVDFCLKNNLGNKILLEAKAINKDLYENSIDGGVNQIKGIFELVEVKENHEFGVATNGFKWVFITKERNFDGEFDIRKDFMKIKDRLIGLRKVISMKEESDITGRFYNWYKALIHGGSFYDHKNKKREISEKDCLVNNISRLRKREERESLAQVVINRLIFTKFLQAKGIIKEDILNYFTKRDGLHLNHALDDFFFRVMNTKIEERLVNLDPIFSQIPYLNGSLFRRTEIEKRYPDYTITPEILKEVINFLNSFKFIHKENSERSETLDPKILGYIFEKAMISAERRSTGSYYTPQMITEHITEKTIHQWIIEQANSYLKKIGYKDVELLRKIDDLFIKPNPASIKTIIEEIISEIRICDNACGSGAFLLAAGEELFKIWSRARDVSGLDIKDSWIRKLIVTENLYGVDINPNAIEIARLRLWLWVADSYQPEKVEPLPNIDFNLRVGNSLIGFANREIKINNQRLLIESIFKTDLDEYERHIQLYKHDGDRTEEMKLKINNLNVKMQKQLDKWYLDTIPKNFKDKFDNMKELLVFIETQNINEFQMEIKFYSEISEELKARLKDQGFSTSKFRARIKIRASLSEMEKINRVLKIAENEDIKSVIVERDPSIDDLKYNKPFHWVIEFPSVFKNDKEGFDIIIGNPPYGVDVLTQTEEKILANYEADNCKDICGYFLEREINLMKIGGKLGNIVAGSLVVNLEMTNVRNFMRKNGKFMIAFFGTRPTKLFPDNEERVALLIGNKGFSSPILTASNYRFTLEQRHRLFHTLKYISTEGLLLGYYIGVQKEEEKNRLPKLGSKIKREIILKLKSYSQENQVLRDIIKQGQYTLQYRQSAGYWIHALLEFPYMSTKIKTLSFQNEVERDFVLICINSSLFYLFWTTYGNNRDLPSSLMEPFPIPKLEILNQYRNEIHDYMLNVNEKQISTFIPTTGRIGEFRSGQCKQYLDIVDNFLMKIYGFEDIEIDYIIKYDDHIRQLEISDIN